MQDTVENVHRMNQVMLYYSVYCDVLGLQGLFYDE